MLNNAKTDGTNNSSNNLFNLTIYQKYLELIYYTNDIVKKFPKTESFALVEKIKNTVYGGLRLLIYCTKVYGTQEKLANLNEFIICLNLLKAQISLSYKYAYITMQNYNTWNNLIASICNMLEKLI